jgi:ubiquinone/menaquinone biosynthesis C-methylase UbiE
MISRERLLGFLECPSCRTPLTSLQGCSGCGLLFHEQSGTPALFPPPHRRKVEFEFGPERSSVPPAQLERWLSHPSPCRPVRGLPHHLDGHHAAVLESLKGGASVLDVGCGGGQMRSWLERLGHAYVGTDISKTRVDAALREFGGPDLLCDAHFLPLRDGVFDVVYSAAATEHLACPFLGAQEAARVLRPGGYYLGNVAFLEPWHDSSFFHMSPLGVIELLTQASFEILHVWPARGWSGYRALMVMGSRLTQALSFVGTGIGVLSRSWLGLANSTKRLLGREVRREIVEDARVAGAIAWIARRSA